MNQNKCKCGRSIPQRYNSTIKAKKCPHCTYLDATSKAKGKKQSKGKTTSPGKSSKSKAMGTADKWFSRYIRIKYHFKILTDGTVLDKCIVSGTIKEAKNMDNGHCFSRQFKTTRYEEDNCRPQNRSSNRFSGEADHYKFIDNLKNEIGPESFERLNKLRREIGEDNEQFYKSKSEKYRKLTYKLISDLKVKKWW